MQSFKEVYSSLNAEQQAAVDQIEGPLLVLAGPGTGKTQLLSARIANILSKTDTGPRSVLALTFTDKAAQNMKQRLLEMIGPEARKVMIKTFHGLGVELINSYPEYFWNEARLRPAPAAVELEIVETILKQLPLDNPYALKFVGKFTKINDIRNQISSAKKAGLTPGKLELISNLNLEYLQNLQEEWSEALNQKMSMDLVEQFQELLADMPESPTGDTAPIQPIGHVLKQSLERAITAALDVGKTGPLTDWRNEWVEGRAGSRAFKDIKRSNKMLALAYIYQQFQEIMQQRQYYDFDDMILEVITQLEQQPDFRAAVQERFNYILLDEFQDTNDAQFRLSYLIANHPLQSGRPNIMAVGDDDQAIYRFQGAELSNIDNFTQAFTDTAEIVLTKNYRSHQSVIDVASQTATMIDYRLVDIKPGLDKTLSQANSEIKKGKIEHKMYSTEAEQLTGVAELAEAAFESGKSTAILSRKHQPLEQLSHIFHSRNTAIKYTRRSNVLEHPAIEAAVDLAELIIAINAADQQVANQQFATIAGMPMFDISPKQLWQFSINQRRQRSRDWLSAAVDSESGQLSALAQWLLELSSLANTEPAAVMLEYIMGLRALNDFKSPIKDYYLNQNQRGYIEALSAIYKLRSLVVEFSDEVKPRLSAFVAFIRLNQAHDVTIADESSFVSDDRSIELLSVHSAKGLEFDHVFIIDAIDGSWQPRGPSFRPPANLEALRPYGDSEDDYARLMFVAMTRAKSDLTVASYSTDVHGRDVLSTPLIQHLPTTAADSTADDITVVENFLRWPEPPKRDQQQQLQPLLENYELPVTHLLNFIDVGEAGPKLFVERNLLRLPTVKTPQLVYGTAIHDALEQAQHDHNLARFSVEGALERFRDSMIRQQLPSTDEQRYIDQGEKLITQLFEEDKLTLNRGDHPERTINGVKLRNGARISGKLDLVQSTDGELIISDYKTGKGLASLDTRSKGYTGKKALKHKLQLTFYGLLAKEAGLLSSGQSMKGKMIYLEAKDARSFSVEHTPTTEEIDDLERLIGAIWQRIMSLDWPIVDEYEDSQFGIKQFIEDLSETN